MQKQLMTKGNTTAACGEKVKASSVEKQAMTPKGLNKGLKRKSQESGIRDQDNVHTSVRRSSSSAYGDENATYPDCRIENVQLPVRDLDEFMVHRLVDAAKHASEVARLKREHAKRLLSKANAAIDVAVSAIVTAAEVTKASYCLTD